MPVGLELSDVTQHSLYSTKTPGKLLKTFVAIVAGSLFPPRDVTKSDVVHVYDKDLCRVWPLRYRTEVTENGIPAGYYTPDDNIFNSEDNEDNMCFCPVQDDCPPKGLQNISPCQFGKHNSVLTDSQINII